MKKTFFGVAAVLGTLLFASCVVQDADPFSAPYTDPGIQVSSITLSANSLSLAGSREITTATLTATVSPSYATDKTITWKSSDTSVVTVSADETDSLTATIMLAGSGKATVTASCGTASATCTVTCEMETTPPVSVSDVSATANGNNVFFTWTDPVDYDNDLSYIEIVAKKSGSTVASTKVNAGVQYGWVTGLATNTAYTFTLTSYDLSGNASDGVTTDTVTTNASISAFTATAVTAPAIETTAESISLSWTAGGVLANSEVWDHIDVAVAGHEELSQTVFYSADAVALTVIGLAAGTNYSMTVTVYNKDFAALTWEKFIRTDAYVATLSYNDSVTETVSGYLPVKLSNIKSGLSYTSITYVIDGADNVSGTATTAEWTGLTLDTDYRVYAAFYKGTTLVGTSNSITKQPTKVLWHLLSGYSSGRYLGRATAESYTIGAITSGVGGDEYWIVHPALSGTANYFSLEAADANGTASGYYMYLDTTGRAQDTGTNLWTSSVGYANKLQVATLSEGLILSSRKDASFKTGSSTIKTGDGWYRFYDENKGYYLCHASLAFGGVAASTSEDTAGCAAIYIEAAYIK